MAAQQATDHIFRQVRVTGHRVFVIQVRVGLLLAVYVTANALWSGTS